jgi:hypothetical protein
MAADQRHDARGPSARDDPGARHFLAGS